MDRNTIRDEADLRLLKGLKNADNKIIQEVYNDILPSVKQYIRENGGEENDARDIFQDALIVIYKKTFTKDFVLSCSLKSYVRIICRNLWLNRLKNKNNQHSSLDIAEEVILDQDVIEMIQNREKRNLFYKYFNELADNCKSILKGYFEKKSVKTIASEHSMSEAYVKKRKFKCKEMLVKKIMNDPIYDQL